MIEKVLGGKLRYIGYPESLCLSCVHKKQDCSLDGARDVELCPDFKKESGQTRLPI